MIIDGVPDLVAASYLETVVFGEPFQLTAFSNWRCRQIL